MLMNTVSAQVADVQPPSAGRHGDLVRMGRLLPLRIRAGAGVLHHLDRPSDPPLPAGVHRQPSIEIRGSKQMRPGGGEMTSGQPVRGARAAVRHESLRREVESMHLAAAIKQFGNREQALAAIRR